MEGEEYFIHNPKKKGWGMINSENESLLWDIVEKIIEQGGTKKEVTQTINDIFECSED